MPQGKTNAQRTHADNADYRAAGGLRFADALAIHDALHDLKQPTAVQISTGDTLIIDEGAGGARRCLLVVDARVRPRGRCKLMAQNPTKSSKAAEAARERGARITHLMPLDARGQHTLAEYAGDWGCIGWNATAGCMEDGILTKNCAAVLDQDEVRAHKERHGHAYATPAAVAATATAGLKRERSDAAIEGSGAVSSVTGLDAKLAAATARSDVIEIDDGGGDGAVPTAKRVKPEPEAVARVKPKPTASPAPAASAAPRFCSMCGAGLVAEGNFCSSCGATVTLAAPPAALSPAPLAAPPPPIASPSPAAAAAGGRVYLNVPFAQKDVAKRLGARWDAGVKQWYAPAGTDAAPLLTRWGVAAGCSTPPSPAGGDGADTAAGCFNCAGTGHWSRDCPSSRGAARKLERLVGDDHCPELPDGFEQCYRCGGVGHYAQQCANRTSPTSGGRGRDRGRGRGRGHGRGRGSRQSHDHDY